MTQEEIEKLSEDHKFQSRKMNPQTDWKKQALNKARAAKKKQTAQNMKTDK